MIQDRRKTNHLYKNLLNVDFKILSKIKIPMGETLEMAIPFFPLLSKISRMPQRGMKSSFKNCETVRLL